VDLLRRLHAGSAVTADYPGAKWVPAHASNYRKAGRVKPQRIVCHITDGHEHAEPVAEMWQQPHHGSSAHFVVGQDGTVIQSVPIVDVAWHAHEANGDSVGIEHCARTPRELSKGDPGLPPSDALYRASARLVAWLCHQYGIMPSRVAIVGHCEADKTTTHTLCPVGNWDWARYMGIVAEEYGG
jgi:N-acetyl-anhydromuramyl-L-alanine amidase AmpD